MERATPGKGTSMWYGLESWEIKVSWGNSKWINLAVGEHCDSKGLAMFGNGGLKTAREGPHMLQVQSRMMGRVVRETLDHTCNLEVVDDGLKSQNGRWLQRSKQGLWGLEKGRCCGDWWVVGSDATREWAQWLLAVLRHWICMAHLSFLVHYGLYLPLVMLP